MDWILRSTLALVGGALILTSIAAGPALWRRTRTREKINVRDDT